MATRPDNGILFTAIDFLGKSVVFTSKKLKEKQTIHPELGKKSFLSAVKKAVENPDEAWQDYNDKENRYCCYKKYSATSYVKVVVWRGSNPNHVVSAYEIDFVKERKYSGLKKIL
jgi:hypothetical protein